MKKSISIVLLAILLLQSCSPVVYQNTSVSINEALDKGNVKVISTQGQNYEYENIVLRDSNYYGKVKSPYWSDLITDINITDIPFNTALDTAKISNIYLKDIKKSNEKSVIWGVTGVVFLGAMLVFMFSAF